MLFTINIVERRISEITSGDKKRRVYALLFNPNITILCQGIFLHN